MVALSFDQSRNGTLPQTTLTHPSSSLTQLSVPPLTRPSLFPSHSLVPLLLLHPPLVHSSLALLSQPTHLPCCLLTPLSPLSLTPVTHRNRSYPNYSNPSLLPQSLTLLSQLTQTRSRLPHLLSFDSPTPLSITSLTFTPLISQPVLSFSLPISISLSLSLHFFSPHFFSPH